MRNEDIIAKLTQYCEQGYGMFEFLQRANAGQGTIAFKGIPFVTVKRSVKNYDLPEIKAKSFALVKCDFIGPNLWAWEARGYASPGTTRIPMMASIVDFRGPLYRVEGIILASVDLEGFGHHVLYDSSSEAETAKRLMNEEDSRPVPTTLYERSFSVPVERLWVRDPRPAIEKRQEFMHANGLCGHWTRDVYIVSYWEGGRLCFIEAVWSNNEWIVGGPAADVWTKQELITENRHYFRKLFPFDNVTWVKDPKAWAAYLAHGGPYSKGNYESILAAVQL